MEKLETQMSGMIMYNNPKYDSIMLQVILIKVEVIKQVRLQV